MMMMGMEYPDYADFDNQDEGNFVPLVLRIDLPEVDWSGVSVAFEYDGPTGVLETEFEEIPDPRGQAISTGFFDYRSARRVETPHSGWEYPAMRVWDIDDPSQYRTSEDIVVSGRTYISTELGFGEGDEPNQVILFVEGLNQGWAPHAPPLPRDIRLTVTVGDEGYSDTVRLTVVEGQLGVNNSSHDPFDDEYTDFGTLRPGVPDATYEVDQYDEVVEDQKDGFVFWKGTGKFNIDLNPIDFFPIVIEIPAHLQDSGFQFFLRVESGDDDDSFWILENPSPDNDLIGYLKQPQLYDAVKYRRFMRKRLSDWSLADNEVGQRLSYLLNPEFSNSLTSETVLTIELVGKDRGDHEVVLDSFKLSLRPMIWSGNDVNDFFWMGSARGVPNGAYPYPADTVAGESVVQTIPLYPEFLWTSGPEPDEGKNNFLVFVHGFNINVDQAFEDAANVYKRLWWSGYRGNYIGLSWQGDEFDPLNHVCDGILPGWFRRLCTAVFFPNIENALQTSSRLKSFLEDRVIGEWGGEPGNIYLLAHSLGNLVALDALRLHSVESSERLVQHMISVEAAVWEETFWDQGPAVYTADLAFSEEELMKASWAFWFNQVDHPVTDAVGRMFNSYSVKDRVLFGMQLNDLLGALGPQCPSPYSDPRHPTAPCPREPRWLGRGFGSNYRVPVADDFLVGDSENRPDLWYEIPALLDSESPMPSMLPWENITKPLGTVAIRDRPDGKIVSFNASEYGWPETEHSWFLEGNLAENWAWFEYLTKKSEDLPNGIIPSGEE